MVNAFSNSGHGNRLAFIDDDVADEQTPTSLARGEHREERSRFATILLQERDGIVHLSSGQSHTFETGR